MKPLALVTTLLLASSPAQAQLASKITHHDPDKTRLLTSVHKGAGTMRYAGLMDAKTLSTNFIFLHRGVLLPGGGIGQHLRSS